MVLTYTLHRINSFDSIGFDPTDYSKFKFGDGEIARRFGKDLAKGFINRFLSKIPQEEQLVVVPYIYSCISTASSCMAQSFIKELNWYLTLCKRPTVSEVKMIRKNTYCSDYGSLTIEERINLIKSEPFHIDSSALLDKTIIFIDDIKITGCHQKMVEQFMENQKLHNKYIFVYFGQLTNNNMHPNFENYLNYYAVKSLNDINNIIHSNDFQFNARNIKYILNQPINECKSFLKTQSLNFVKTMYNLSICNNYHLIPQYKENLKSLKKIIDNQ